MLIVKKIWKDVPQEVLYHIEKEDHMHFLRYPTVNRQESAYEFKQTRLYGGKNNLGKGGVGEGEKKWSVYEKRAKINSIWNAFQLQI